MVFLPTNNDVVLVIVEEDVVVVLFFPDLCLDQIWASAGLFLLSASPLHLCGFLI